MKLSDLHIALVAKSLNVQALDPEDDATKMLVDTFGDHTFYLDPGGLTYSNIPRAKPVSR